MRLAQPPDARPNGPLIHLFGRMRIISHRDKSYYRRRTIAPAKPRRRGIAMRFVSGSLHLAEKPPSVHVGDFRPCSSSAVVGERTGDNALIESPGMRRFRGLPPLPLFRNTNGNHSACAGERYRVIRGSDLAALYLKKRRESNSVRGDAIEVVDLAAEFEVRTPRQCLGQSVK